MAKKKAKGNAQANTKKEEVVSTNNATAEDPQATTRNAKTGKEKGTSRNLRARGANKGDKIVDGIDGSEAATEKEKGISTENAAAQDPQATTEDANTEKKKGTSRGRGTEVVGVGDKAKGNNPSEVKEEPNGEEPISSSWTLGANGRMVRRQDETTSGDKGKGKEVVIFGEKAKGNNPWEIKEEPNGEEPISPLWTRSANGRMVRRQDATTSGDEGKGKEVVIVGDKADGKKLMTDGIALTVDLPIQRVDTPEKAGDTPKTRDSGETVSVKLGSAVNEGDEIAGEKKGIDGSEVAKKSSRKKSAAPKVGNDNDVIKAVTSTSAKVQEVEAVVNNEEKQSEKSGNAEDGEGLGKSKKRKREENEEVRRGPHRKARKDQKNK